MRSGPKLAQFVSVSAILPASCEALSSTPCLHRQHIIEIAKKFLQADCGSVQHGRTGGIGHEPYPAMGQGGEQRTDPLGRTDKPRIDSGAVMRVSIDELMHLAPRLRPYLKSPRPAWPEIVDAADWLRGELGVSKSLWGEACVAMGREEAAIAVGIVSAKPAEYFRSTPGGYFHGMVAKAKAGELNLARTIWGFRQARSPNSHRLGKAGGTRPAQRTWS